MQAHSIAEQRHRAGEQNSLRLPHGGRGESDAHVNPVMNGPVVGTSGADGPTGRGVIRLLAALVAVPGVHGFHGFHGVRAWPAWTLTPRVGGHPRCGSSPAR